MRKSFPFRCPWKSTKSTCQRYPFLRTDPARRVLEDWIRRADASGIRMLNLFARTLEEHRDGILAFYDYRISTGPLEGINNKIKTMKRQAYGFRDKAFFKPALSILTSRPYHIDE